MSKRISALLLAMVLVAVSVLNGNTLKVKAASATVAMSPELAAEFYMFLYQLTETAMHVGGANNGLDSKEAMESLRDGVIGYYSASGEKDVDFEIKTTDGRTFKSVSGSSYSNGLVEYTTAEGQTYKLSWDKFTTLLLNGTITLDPDIYNDTDEEPTVNDDDEYVKNMKAMFDAKWEELREIGFKDDSGDPTPSPSPDPEKKPFKNIALVTVGASLVALVGAFVKDLFDGNVKGLTAEDYYTGLGFTGKLDQNADGKYIISGFIITQVNSSDYTYFPHYTFDSVYSFSSTPVVGVYSKTNNVNTSTSISFRTYSSSLYSPRIQSFYRPYNTSGNPMNSGSYNTGFSFSSSVGCSIEYALNIPVFDSEDHALSFFKSKRSIASTLTTISRFCGLW